LASFTPGSSFQDDGDSDSGTRNQEDPSDEAIHRELRDNNEKEEKAKVIPIKEQERETDVNPLQIFREEKKARKLEKGKEKEPYFVKKSRVAHSLPVLPVNCTVE